MDQGHERRPLLSKKAGEELLQSSFLAGPAVSLASLLALTCKATGPASLPGLSYAKAFNLEGDIGNLERDIGTKIETATDTIVEVIVETTAEVLTQIRVGIGRNASQRRTLVEEVVYTKAQGHIFVQINAA